MIFIVYEWVRFVFCGVVCVVVEPFLLRVGVVCEVVRPILSWVVVVCVVVWPILLSVIVYREILFIVSFIWKVFFFSWGLLILGQFVCIWYFGALVFLLRVVVCVWRLYLLYVYCVFGRLFVFLFPFVRGFFSFSFSFSFGGRFYSYVLFFIQDHFYFSSSFLQFFSHNSFRNGCVSMGQSSLISVISSW